MSQSNQVLWFDAVPLLVVAVAYLGASGVQARRLLAGGDRFVGSLVELSVFPVIGVAALTYGMVLAVERETPVGGIWLTFGLSLLVGVPALGALLTGGPAQGSAPSDELQSRVAVSTVLGSTSDAGTVAGALLDQAQELAGVELAAVFVVDYETRMASGLLGRVNGRTLDWFSEARIDLDNEPSGVGTAVFEASAFAVYDAPAS